MWPSRTVNSCAGNKRDGRVAEGSVAALRCWKLFLWLDGAVELVIQLTLNGLVEVEVGSRKNTNLLLEFRLSVVKETSIDDTEQKRKRTALFNVDTLPSTAVLVRPTASFHGPHYPPV